jgi:hypothetical protein
MILPLLFALLIPQFTVPSHTGAPAITAPVITPTGKTCAAINATASSVPCTWSSNPAAGETVVCGAYNFAGSPGTFSMTDSGSNSYTGETAHTGIDTTSYMQIWYINVPLTGSISTNTVSATGTPSFLSITCNSYTGGAASSPTNGTCVGDSTSGLPVTCGTSITTTAADYIMCIGHNGGTLTAGTGFTLAASAGANVSSEYLVQGSAGTITPTMSQLASGDITFVCGAFKP